MDYSEEAAFRRIKAMKLCRDMPDAEKNLKEGALSLSSASQLQNFFEKRARKILSINSTQKPEANKNLSINSTQKSEARRAVSGPVFT